MVIKTAVWRRFEASMSWEVRRVHLQGEVVWVDMAGGTLFGERGPEVVENAVEIENGGMVGCFRPSQRLERRV